MVSVLFFAGLSEALTCRKRELCLKDKLITVTELIKLLSQEGDHWHSELTQPNIIIAVNQVVAHANTAIADGDEIAFYPPVSGG